MAQKKKEIPTYMTADDEDFKNLSVAPITGSEESIGGFNALVQTGDEDKIAFAGVKSMSNQDLLYSLSNPDKSTKRRRLTPLNSPPTWRPFPPAPTQISPSNLKLSGNL